MSLQVFANDHIQLKL